MVNEGNGNKANILSNGIHAVSQDFNMLTVTAVMNPKIMKAKDKTHLIFIVKFMQTG